MLVHVRVKGGQSFFVQPENADADKGKNRDGGEGVQQFALHLSCLGLRRLYFKPVQRTDAHFVAKQVGRARKKDVPAYRQYNGYQQYHPPITGNEIQIHDARF